VTATAREVAFRAIFRVTEQGGYSNLAIPGALRGSTLSAEDRAFATELAYGTIRRVIPLDRAIERHSSRPVSRMTSRVRVLLRLGAYQLLFLRTPAHAAVGETVGLAGHRERGFVNAVLRRVAADPPPSPVGESDRDVSARTGMAPWAVAELRRLLGEETEPAAEALAERASLCLRVNTCRTTVEEVERALHAAGHDPRGANVHPDCLLLDRARDPAELPGFGEGLFAVQDQASAFVVSLLDPRPGESVADVCAGPGGKAVYAACLVGDEGVVVAGDVNARRAVLVARNGRRLGVDPRVLAMDARAPAVRGPFDKVLVDAPCSGLGSARRRPELLWRGGKAELSGLARLQVAITSAAAELLRSGGTLVYSVCTFPRAETDAAVDAILRHRADLNPIPTSGPDGAAERHRLWPHRHGCDAMFAAAFRREASPHR
jgi:16S rRNA (cytosine967-C5)-methyltransferase